MEYKLISERNISDSLIEQILKNRGINDVEHYLNTSAADLLPPSSIANIQLGAKMLLRHILAQDKIFLQVDADCDGYTSAAILLNYLHELFPTYVENNITYRMHEEKLHGILLDTIPKDVKLVIIPDAGSNQYDLHKALQEQGIDVLIIDHHEASEVSPYACVINNQLCDYPTKSLSGAGMVYKFCKYLDTLTNNPKVNADKYLDLAALGIIADVMSMKDYETKEIINLGLDNITNVFMSNMVMKNSYSLGDTVTPIGVAFYIAPAINAITRSGTMKEKELVFNSLLDYKANDEILSNKRGHLIGEKEELVEQAIRTCNNVKSRQTKSRETGTITVEGLIEKNNLLVNKVIVVQLTKPIDKNLTGLIATQIANEYQRPTAILNKTKDENDNIVWSGSARGYDKSELKDFKLFCNDSGLVEFGEGHKNAFGLAIKDENVQDFIDYANEKLKDIDFTAKYDVDCIYQADTMPQGDILEIGSCADLWGQDITEPLVAIEKVKIQPKDVFLLKNNTIKFNIPTSQGIELIKFRCTPEEVEELNINEGYIELNVVGTCSINTWNGNQIAQILIKDYEIVKKLKYYF